MDISQIDLNLKVKSGLNEKDIVWFDVRKEPFDVYGFYDYRNEPVFRRMPESIALATSDGVAALHTNTAGGRVRFKTDSSYIAIKAEMSCICLMPHMPFSGSSGFDLYRGANKTSTYVNTFMPSIGMQDGYESIAYLREMDLQDYTINFPLYSNVSNLYVGLQKGAVLQHGSRYFHEKPVVYYGSSITQGGCASRPGNSYQNFISRRLDTNYINLGFSGSGKAEDSITAYMAGLDMSVFVCDYDHNAPDADYLRQTHKRMYMTIRQKQKNVPYVILTRPNYDSDPVENEIRWEIIYTTYLDAVNSGDKNVYFIDGKRLFGNEDRDACTVDGCHPNDFGFSRMADVIGHTLKELI